MKLCLAGTRGYYGPSFYVAARMAISQAVKKFNINDTIDEIVSGMCENSPDWIGVDLANEAGIPLKECWAKWEDLTVPGAVIRKRRGRLCNIRAGHMRNQEVAEYLAQYEHLVVLLWDGKSPGTTDFKKHCVRLNLRWHELIPNFQEVAHDG